MGTPPGPTSHGALARARHIGPLIGLLTVLLGHAAHAQTFGVEWELAPQDARVVGRLGEVLVDPGELASDWNRQLRATEHRDPLQLRRTKVTKALAPYEVDGTLMMVVESRLGENRLNAALGLEAGQDKVGAANWARAKQILGELLRAE